MKRKSEVSHQIEQSKVASLSPFLMEETLNVSDIETDVDEFLDCYNRFVKYVTEVYDRRENTTVAAAANFILKFKQLNRRAQFRLSKVRDSTKETKDAINKSHLMMQNLLYEALHLEKETNSCLEYKSLHEEIDLVSLDQFSTHAPLELQSAVTDHELTLNRLHWELCERKNLSAQIKEAEIAEQQLMEEISRKKKAYSDISINLRKVFDSTQSLEDIFDMPMHCQAKENELVEKLCEPLFVLYTQLRVHVECEGQKNMKVSLVEQPQQETGHSGVGVVLQLTEGDGMTLTLSFHYDEVLSLVTVSPRLEGLTVTQHLSSLTKSLTDPVHLLSELPGERGCPLDSTWVKTKMSSPLSLDNDNNNNINGVPYLWCQRLAGSFSDLSSSSTVTNGAVGASDITRVPPQTSLSQLLLNIRQRLLSRLSLLSQLSSIVSTSNSSKTCLLHDWTSSSFDKFTKTHLSALSAAAASAPQDSSSSSLVSTGLVSQHCFFYTATLTITANPAINIWIVVPHNYPHCHPLFIFNNTTSVTLQQQLSNSNYNQDYIKQALHLIEVEVNCYCEELSPECLLSSQILRLQSAVEILFLHYLHGDNKTTSPPLFIGHKFTTVKRPFKTATSL